MGAEHWWDVAARAFDRWLEQQPDEVREDSSLLQQIELYADSQLPQRGGVE